MKKMIATIFQLVGLFLVLAFFCSLANHFFGWHFGMEGQDVPDDPRAAVIFLIVGLVSVGCAYLLMRSGKSRRPQ